ncbi:hypothetical protein ABT083_31765 [Streptomyces goshikiensis]|uniref:hypothetical protein n=1 Tax=Streptomyces goshikiensis TaxID=1942 RepID=UPI0033259AF3
MPALLDQVEHTGSAEAWDDLWDELCLEGETVVPASFAALPRLVALGQRSPEALSLAGSIMRGALQDHGADDLLLKCADVVVRLRMLLDQRLKSRPDDYLDAFRDLLAADGQYHWSAVLGDFTDDFYHLRCPHCDLEVTIAIGDCGRYSAIRDWHAGDVERRDLKPASPEALVATGRWMYDTAVRDDQDRLAHGLTYLFGRAECPRCASTFAIAAEYTAANLPSPGE